MIRGNDMVKLNPNIKTIKHTDNTGNIIEYPFYLCSCGLDYDCNAQEIAWIRCELSHIPEYSSARTIEYSNRQIKQLAWKVFSYKLLFHKKKERNEDDYCIKCNHNNRFHHVHFLGKRLVMCNKCEMIC